MISIQKLSEVREEYLKELQDISITNLEELSPKYKNAKSIQKIITQHFIEYVSTKIPNEFNGNSGDYVLIDEPYIEDCEVDQRFTHAYVLKSELENIN